MTTLPSSLLWERLVLIPHQCRYGHKWMVPLPNGFSYPDPSRRFCLKCLEWGRIEVASIQLETSGMDGGRIDYECPQCTRITHIALPIDHVGCLFTEESLEESLFATRPRWYHLPQRWPTMCKHDLRK